MLYVAWSLLPVLIAVLFSFNAGRSRTGWQGFSLRWYFTDPEGSVWRDPSLHTALLHTLRLGVLVTLITIPVGVMLALGLDRWRGRVPAWSARLPDSSPSSCPTRWSSSAAGC